MRILAMVTSGLVAVCAHPARATVIAADDFTYPDGALEGRGTATGGWINAWTNIGLDVVSGQAVTNSFANPPKYVSRTFTNPAATTELFVKFTFTAPPAFVTSDYFALALTIGANNSVLYVGKASTTNNFGVGASGLADTGIAITPGQTYTIVAGVVYTHAAIPNRQLLWVNPDASDFYNAATGANSADFVSSEPNFFNAATVTLYSNLAGVKFDNLVLCDNIAGAIPACSGDVNGDGMTNISDFNILAGNFGQSVPPNTLGDLTGDGLVNISDFNILAGDFGCS